MAPPGREAPVHSVPVDDIPPPPDPFGVQQMAPGIKSGVWELQDPTETRQIFYLVSFEIFFDFVENRVSRDTGL